jgi:hypothetical protein
MVVDTKSLNMLDSSSWNEILDELSRIYLSVYDRADPARPVWLDQREELSHLVLSLSTTPLKKEEVAAIATRLAAEHGRFNDTSKTWAMGEVKWLIQHISKSPTLMAGFMALPGDLKVSPGPVAPVGHSMAGRPMRVAMAHAMFTIVASSRRVAPIEQVKDQTLGAQDSMKGYTVHADGSVSKSSTLDEEEGGDDEAPDGESSVSVHLQDEGAAAEKSWSAPIKEE